MYQYTEFDKAFVAARAQHFRGLVERRLAGDLTEEQFKPLRLQNGLYLQLHAYMLRVAIPYGVLAARQMRQLARIARRWDRGFGHFTTRQNIQFNWIALDQAPDIIDALADVDMHAIQTSGNCIRNVTTDPYAGVAVDELEDPRIWAEILRQWSTNHPEFLFLPRKFKIAITGAAEDRAAIKFHDIGLKLVKSIGGQTGFRVYVGGGQGRSPYIAQELNNFVPKGQLLSYLEAIMRVYNLHGRRDNIYKARIKSLVNALGIDELRRQVDQQWQSTGHDTVDMPPDSLARIAARFASPRLDTISQGTATKARHQADPAFAHWLAHNVAPHRNPNYAIVNVSLKEPGQVPGDATADQMDAISDLAERYSSGEIRVTYQQNLVLPYVARDDLAIVFDRLVAAGLATANTDLITDIISCPGLDFCNLANARAIPIAQQIALRFQDHKRASEIGPLRLNISGCINACGHHHAANIGILGVDKKGTEHYQITLGGSPTDQASIGEIIGPSFPADQVAGAIEKLIDVYLAARKGSGETFLDAYHRLGKSPFHKALYGRTRKAGGSGSEKVLVEEASGV